MTAPDSMRRAHGNPSMHYPPTRADQTTDTLAGHTFPDPYRWLENDTDDVLTWQRAQARLAQRYVRSWPGYDRVHRLVEQFSTPRPERGGMPVQAGGRWFRIQGVPDALQARAVVADSPMGEGRVLFDPVWENETATPFLSWISPSPDGKTLALGVCADASENNTIRIIDVDSGRLLPDPPPHVIMDIYAGGAHWLADSSGFFFSAITGAPIDFDQQVYFHLRGPQPSTVMVRVPWLNERDYKAVTVSRDGRYAVALQRLYSPVPVAFARLDGRALCWRSFITDARGTVAGHMIGDRFIAVTDVDAPRGRLVAIDPQNPSDWQELCAQSEAVLRTVTPVGDVLYLTEFIDTYTRIRVIDKAGNQLSLVRLPFPGAIHELPYPLNTLTQRNDASQFIFAFSSLTVSAGIYSHTPGADHIDVLQQPRVRLDDAMVERCTAMSADGTAIPYQILRNREMPTGRACPALIYAYGGFNFPILPQFPGAMAAFVAAGGIYVHAHLRGGGEFGRAWWKEGSLGQKENCYDDLFAIAEDLIARRRTTRQQLAVTGVSNGGLLAAVAVTKRPELFAAAATRVPRIDLIGSCREPYGLMSTLLDRADASNADEVRRLARFSPYHLVHRGVTYPAIFIEAGGTDPRCPAWHGRKFAAALQAANTGESPIILYVREDVGHGWATDRKTALEQNTEWLAFIMQNVGLIPGGQT